MRFYDSTDLPNNVSLTLYLANFFLIFIYIPFSLVSLSLNVRRLHDMGASGWLAVLFVALFYVTPNLITFLILGILISVIMFIFPGNKDENEYGKRIQSFNINHLLFNVKDKEYKSDAYIWLLVLAVMLPLVYKFFLADIIYSQSLSRIL